MSNESRYFKLGLFVLTGLALLVGGVVMFGAGALFTEYVTVETATTESVQGLDVGSAVKYMGVPIGKVSKIEMAIWNVNDKNPDRQAQIRKFITIEMSIRREMVRARSAHELGANLDRMVEQGLRVRMASSGLTGPPYLEAVFLDPTEHAPVALPWKPKHPYLPSTPSTITQIVSGLEDILSQVRKVEFGRVVGQMEKLMAGADQAIQDLQVATVREKAVALVDEVRASNRRVKDILDDPRVDKTLQDVSDAVAGGKDVLTGPETKAFLADLPRISGRMRETMERVDEIVRDPKLKEAIDAMSETAASAAPAAADLRRVMRRLDVLLATQRQDLEAIVMNLRRALEDGSALIEDAKSNPSRAIFGSPPARVEIRGQK